MKLHKDLEKQVLDYLPEGSMENPSMKAFIRSINHSYLKFEQSREILSESFTESVSESLSLNQTLSRENEVKKQSIEKLKKAIKKNDPSSIKKGDENDLLGVVNYVSSQMNDRKGIEKELNRTVNLLVTLLTNMHAGILVEDENHKVLFSNELFCDTFKVTIDPDNLKGHDYSQWAEQNKHMFKDPENFLKRTTEILQNREKVLSEELQLADGQYVERDFVPIYLHNNYKGHLWKYENITERKNTESRLRYLNDTQEAVLNGTNYAIVFADTKGVIKSFNKGAEKMLGYKAEEMINLQTPAVFLYQPEIEAKAAKLSRELSTTIQPGFEALIINPKKGRIETHEWTYIRKNGQKFPVSQTVCSIKNANEEITGYLWVSRNLSEEKQTEEALKISEEKYRNIIEKSTDIIYKTNKNGFFNFVNPVAERITGFSKRELANMHFSELIRPDYKKTAMLFYRKQVEAKKSTTYLEFPIVTKLGLEKWIGQSVQYFQIGEDDYELTSLAMDITEKKIHEKSILVQEEKYRNIIANINLGLVEVDMDEIIKYCNQAFCELSGYTTAELIGKNILELLVVEENRDWVKNKIHDRLAGMSDTYETLIRNKNGELRWWMISGAPNYDDAGNLIGTIGIHLDVTERKNLENELEASRKKAEESSKAKEAFLANMSHEIRTPLNAIIGMLRELSLESLNENQRMYLQNTSTASQHLFSVLNNILDVSKIEAGEFNLDAQHFSFNGILNDVKSIMGNKALEKNLFLNVSVSNAVRKTLIGDPVRIKQILLNLVGNAIKFTDKGGITLKCELESGTTTEQTLSLSIIDTGIGMDNSYLKNIFTKFSQEDISTSRKYGGTGLGMAITRELVHLMKGNIDVESQKNVGTVVTVKLSLPIGDDSKIIKEKILLQNTKGSNKIKVLLTEDNEFNRLVATKTLNRYNCVVTEAINGLEAVEKLKKESFDVILMDLQMPLMDGIEATTIIRNQLQIVTPIIALTANAFKNEIENCMKMGMNDYVTKPFEEKQLMESILKNVELHKQEQKAISLTNGQIIGSDKKLYDMSKLTELCSGDPEFLKKMVEIFINQSSVSAKQLREAIAVKDLETVYQVSHKIKPGIDSMGIDCLKMEIREIEKDAKAKIYSTKMEHLVSYTDSILQKVVLDLEKEVL
jgi:PAS domain S-box-containing protein